MSVKILLGKAFNNYTPVAKKNGRWVCRCKCGAQKSVETRTLRRIANDEKPHHCADCRPTHLPVRFPKKRFDPVLSNIEREVLSSKHIFGTKAVILD